VIKIIAVLWSLAFPANCYEQVVTTCRRLWPVVEYVCICGRDKSVSLQTAARAHGKAIRPQDITIAIERSDQTLASLAAQQPRTNLSSHAGLIGPAVQLRRCVSTPSLMKHSNIGASNCSAILTGRLMP
jgi:hypothetical protein